MRLSIFTTITDPIRRGDCLLPVLQCYADLANEVVIIDGGNTTIHDMTGKLKNIKSYWPQEFSWELIGQKMTEGYKQCTGDWCIKADLDYIFHEKDFGKIRQAIRDYPHSPAISLYKWQFIQPDRYNLKSRLAILVNKNKFGDRIKFDSGGDLCNVSLDGKQLDLNELPQAGVPIYNYEHLLKTKEQTTQDVERMDRAYYRHFNKWLYSDNGVGAFDGWLRMMKGRYQKPSEKLSLEKHPKYIQGTIKNLRPEQFGHNGWGELK